MATRVPTAPRYDPALMEAAGTLSVANPATLPLHWQQGVGTTPDVFQPVTREVKKGPEVLKFKTKGEIRIAELINENYAQMDEKDQSKLDKFIYDSSHHVRQVKKRAVKDAQGNIVGYRNVTSHVEKDSKRSMNAKNLLKAYFRTEAGVAKELEKSAKGQRRHAKSMLNSLVGHTGPRRRGYAGRQYKHWLKANERLLRAQSIANAVDGGAAAFGDPSVPGYNSPEIAVRRARASIRKGLQTRLFKKSRSIGQQALALDGLNGFTMNQPRNNPNTEQLGRLPGLGAALPGAANAVPNPTAFARR
jgi:hypothetical protein